MCTRSLRGEQFAAARRECEQLVYLLCYEQTRFLLESELDSNSPETSNSVLFRKIFRVIQKVPLKMKTPYKMLGEDRA